MKKVTLRQNEQMKKCITSERSESINKLSMAVLENYKTIPFDSVKKMLQI